MKSKNTDGIKFTLDITEDAYKRLTNYVSACGVDEAVGIQKIVRVWVLQLKLDMIKKKNDLLSSHAEYLREEMKHFVSEISRLEKLCNEYKKDTDYIKKRLRKLNAENKELEMLLIQQSSALRKGI